MDALPIKCKSHKQQTIDASLYPIYLQEDETSGHILWAYPSTYGIWLLDDKVLLESLFKCYNFWCYFFTDDN